LLNTKNFVEDLKLFALLLTFLAMCVFTVLLGIYDERLLLWFLPWVLLQGTRLCFLAGFVPDCFLTTGRGGSGD
jgi:hypothetical protein